VLRITTKKLGQGRRSAWMVEESERRNRLNPMNSKVEKARRSSKKVGKMGRSSRNVEKNEIEEIATIRRLRKVDESRIKSRRGTRSRRSLANGGEARGRLKDKCRNPTADSIRVDTRSNRRRELKRFLKSM
jgi:hypothetical protein